MSDAATRARDSNPIYRRRRRMNTVMMTGTTVSPSFALRALKALQNSMMLTPC